MAWSQLFLDLIARLRGPQPTAGSGVPGSNFIELDAGLASGEHLAALDGLGSTRGAPGHATWRRWGLVLEDMHGD